MDEVTRLSDMGHQCGFCNGRSFRRSHLKGKDWIGLLLGRYPVRCLTCSQRQTVGLAVARRSVPSSVKQVRHSQSSHAADDTAHDRGQHQAAKLAGGGEFPALRTPLTVAMPDLHGVTLEHHTPVQHNEAEHRTT